MTRGVGGMNRANETSQLGSYTAKRDFTATPEPQAARVVRSGPLLFVVQQHAARRLPTLMSFAFNIHMKSYRFREEPNQIEEAVQWERL